MKIKKVKQYHIYSLKLNGYYLEFETGSSGVRRIDQGEILGFKMYSSAIELHLFDKIFKLVIPDNFEIWQQVYRDTKVFADEMK